MNRTPLYETHLKQHARIIEFGGWEMPVEYAGILEEHLAVRGAAGLFDVSHMGELLVEGPGAEQFVQHLVTNDISGAPEGRCIYSPMCNPQGGTVDDLLIYKFPDSRYLLIVNAANVHKDYNWIFSHCPPDASVHNLSDFYAQISIQGPRAQKILQKLAHAPLDSLKFYHFLPQVLVAGVPVLLSRTGYTGEDGFELYFDPDKAPLLWQNLLEVGKEEGIVPAGLGARDTLRLEAALPLYGHELSDSISPLEAGLSRFVKLQKPDFIGREALLGQQEQGIPHRLTGLVLTERGIARSGCEIASGGKNAGVLTSGGYSPSLRKSISMALLFPQAPEDDLTVVIRGKPVKASAAPLPFYKKSYKK